LCGLCAGPCEWVSLSILPSPLPELQHAPLPLKCCELGNVPQLFTLPLSFLWTHIWVLQKVGGASCKVASQVRDPEEFHMLPGVQRVWGNEPSHSQVNSHVGSWSPERTPKSSEHDCRGQICSLQRVLYIIEKVLKCRCPKWPRMSHLDICSTSYGQKKGRESNCQFEINRLPTTKSRESTRFTWLQATCHISLESSRQGLQLCFRPHCDRRFAEEVMHPQSPESPCWRDFGTPTRESRERKAIWMQAPWSVTEYTIRGKVVASPKSGPWWVLCVRVARGLS
jgi:hypothetical protein